MMPLLLHLSSLLTEACVAGLWQGVAVVGMGAALCALMPRASAGLRHSILVALFTGALVLPWVSFRRSVGGTANHGLQLAPWIGAAVASLWLAAAAVRAVQLYLAWRHLCTVRRNATPVEVQGMGEFQVSGRRAVLCSSAEVDSPSILGFFSPRLLLPDWMVPLLSRTELEQIALHECEHLRRGDDWMNLLIQAGIMLSPLNPALLWLDRRIRVQRELAVDAAVVAQTAQPFSYARCLTRLAEQRREHGRLQLALAAWERKSELVQRVHALLDQTSLWTRRQSAWAAGTASVALLSVATGMAHAPQFVHVNENPIEVVANQTPAAVAPMTSMAGMSQGSHAGIVPAQMIPASFHIKSDRPSQLHAKRKKTADKVRNSPDLKATLMLRREGTPHWVRTRDVLPRSTFPARSETIRTVRLIDAEFIPPYVALPTSNGWLLIEL